jgi:two-component system chemotaxis sensor kinase CheA
VLEITRVSDPDIHIVDRHEVMQLRDEVLTLVRLQSIGTPPVNCKRRHFIVVVSLGQRKFGLIVDRLVGEEELVIKALDDDYVDTEMVSGASILGDGTVVLILNLTAVVERLGRANSGGRNTVGASA